MYFEEDYVPESPNREFNEALNDLLDTEIEERLRERVADYDRMHRDYTKQNKELLEAREQVRSLSRQLEDTKDTSFKTGKQFGMREAFGGYKIGDAVYFVRNRYKRLDCPACEKKREVEVEFNGVKTMVRCPSCDGQGSKGTTSQEVSNGTITEVKSTIWNRGKSSDVTLNIEAPGVSDSFSLSPEGVYRKEEEAIAQMEKMLEREKESSAVSKTKKGRGILK